MTGCASGHLQYSTGSSGKQLGNNLIKAGNAIQSIPYLEFFLETQPDRADVSEKLESARRIEHLERETGTSPDSTELFIHMAYQYLLLSNRMMADSLISLAFQMDPQNILLNQIFPGMSD